PPAGAGEPAGRRRRRRDPDRDRERTLRLYRLRRQDPHRRQPPGGPRHDPRRPLARRGTGLMRPDASAAPRPPNQPRARAAIGLVAERRVTAAELAKAHLARIAARDHEIGAFAHFDPHAVLDAVGPGRGDAVRPARGGALDGLLVAIKDNFDTGDM